MSPIYLPAFPGREITYNGRNYLYFGGTSYLSIQELPEFRDLLCEEIRRFGSNYGASRLSNVRMDIFSRTERFLSQWVGSEASLLMSSGFLAGQLLARYYSSPLYKLFYSEQAHAALFAGEPNVYSGFPQLQNALLEHLNSKDLRIPVIVFDTIDLSPDTYPEFTSLAQLPLESCVLVADDSHGIGLTGREGNGAFERLQELRPLELTVCCSLGKALGIQAGAVFGSSERLKELRRTHIYSGASPPPPAYLSTLLKAGDVYHRQRDRLFSLLDLFNQKLDFHEVFHSKPAYPVYLSENKDLASYLEQEGILVTHFDYPAENKTWQSRIVLSASHGAADIDYLTEKLNNFHKAVRK